MTTVTQEPIEDNLTVMPAASLLEQQTRGEVDVQITTAKRYPRSIRGFIQLATEMATLDEDTAASCFYAIPRDGKTVEGPSARLAEICASAWGNMRAQARIVAEDDRFVTAQGGAWDLQTNVAFAFEVKRRITTSEKKGRDGTVKAAKKYSDDMVGVTGNAASSIALRNAVLKVIPSTFWRPIYLKCREVAVGNAETLANRRAKMLAYFQKMGVTNARVFEMLGVPGIEDVTLEHMATLHGLATAIKDGDTTVDEAFPSKVQPSTAVPEPDEYQAFVETLRIAAMKGTDALTAELAAASLPLREFLTKHQNTTWEAMKAAARNADHAKATAKPAEGADATAI